MGNSIKKSITNLANTIQTQWLRQIAATVLIATPLIACDSGGSYGYTSSGYRVTESYDNRAIATDIDTLEDSVVTTGIYVGTRTPLSANVMNEDNQGQGIFVLKHDKAGVRLWDRTIHIEQWNSVSHMDIDQRDGSIVIVGHTGPMPIDDSDLAALDMFDDAVAKDEDVTTLGVRPGIPYGAAKLNRSWLIVKLDSQGNELFRKTWRECLPDTYDWNTNQFLCTCEAKRVAVGETGNIYIAGTAGSPWPMEKVHIAGFDTNGNPLWDDLRSDLHVGPIDTSGVPVTAPLDAIDEKTIFDNNDAYKIHNYDTGRLMHYAWDLTVETTGNGDEIYATLPVETKSQRGIVKLNQTGDIVASRKIYFDNLVTKIKPIDGQRTLIAGQVDKPGDNDNAEASVTLLDSNLNTLADYSYSVFDGVTFDIVQNDSDSVFAAANVIGIANKDVSLFKLSGIDSNTLSIEWDTLYSTTPVTIPILSDLIESYSVDNGKRLFINNVNQLSLVGDGLKTEGVFSLDLPDEDFVEPIISGGLDSKLFGFIPLLSANFNVDLNLPDELHIGVMGADSVRFETTFNTNTGAYIKTNGALSEELSTPHVIAQRSNGKLVQVTRSWQYDDNHLRSIKVLQQQ